MNDILFYASLVIGALILLRFSGKILSKLIGLVLFALVAFTMAYFLGIGPFKPTFTDIYAMEEKFCEGEQKNDTICDCIVKPMVATYNEKFTPEELEALKNDKPESAYVFAKVIQSIKDDSDACLEERENKNAWSLFYKEVLPFDLGLDHLNHLKEKFGSILEDKKDRKENIDEKFEN